MKYTNQHNSCTAKLNRKLNALSDQQTKCHITANTNNYIHNATKIDIPDDVKFLMGLGPKFGLPSTKEEIPVFNIIADLEGILNQRIEPWERNNIRYNTTNVLKKAVSVDHLTLFDNFLLEKKKSCIEFLKNNKEIICVRSDKGGKTVFMERSDYVLKSEELLSDTTTYQKVADPTTAIQKINNTFVNKLFDRKRIDYATKCKLMSHHATPPLMYFLPKHHKQNRSDLFPLI